MMLIAAVLGSSTRADLYFIASIVPLTLGGIGGEALYVSVLPAAVEFHGSADRLFSAGFWVSTSLLAALTAFYVLSVVVVVPLLEPAGSAGLLPWLAFAPVVLLLGLATYCAAVLLYYERYVLPPFRTAAAALVTLVLTAVAFVLGGGVIAIGLAVSAGYAFALLLLLLELRTIGRLAIFRFPDRQSLHLVLGRWRQFVDSLSSGLIGGQVFVLIERVLAAPLGVGAVSSLSYARGVAFTPTLLSSSIAQGIYPGIMRARAADAQAYVRETFISGLRLTVFVAMAVATYVALFAGDVTTVLFQWGAVTSRSLTDLADALEAFALGLMGSMLMILTARVLSALDHFRGIVLSQAAALVVYLVVAPVLRAAGGTAGLALAFGIAEVAGAAIAVATIARRIDLGPGAVVSRALAPAFARALVVAAALVLTKLALPGASSGTLVVVILSAIVGVVVAAVMLVTASWPELRSVKGVLHRNARP